MSEKIVNLSVILGAKEQEEVEIRQNWLVDVQNRLEEMRNGLADGSLQGLVTIGIPADMGPPDIDLFGNEPVPLPVLLGYLEASKLDIAAYHMSYDDE